MAAEQRKLLEQLMGGGAASRGAQLSLTDPKVCRSYLVGTCPHDLFTNTKQDLGACPKVHSEALKAEYEALPEQEKKRYGFDYDYMRACRNTSTSATAASTPRNAGSRRPPTRSGRPTCC